MAINKNINDILTQNNYFKSLLGTLSELIWLKDKDGYYLYCNHEFELFFGATLEEIIGKTDFDFVDKELAEFFRENDLNALHSDKATVNEEWISYASLDKKVYLKTTKQPMYNDEGVLIGILGIGHDITYLHEAKTALDIANKELSKLASHDALTTLANRRSFDQHFEYQWKHCLREKIPLSLLIIDVDFFKQYNDFYGHECGDHCLSNIGNLLNNRYANRPNDLAVRYGGEEFAIILSGANSHAALNIGEQLRLDIMNLDLAHKKTQVKPLESKVITVSIGVASIIPEDDKNKEDLFRLADQALYVAKGEGRNQCFINK